MRVTCAPIYPTSLSFHSSSFQVHVECPILRGSEGARSPPETEPHFFFSPSLLLSPLSLSLPQFSTFDKLTPKPCFIRAPQAVDDTSFRWRSTRWLTHRWWTEGARMYMISQPGQEMGSVEVGKNGVSIKHSRKRCIIHPTAIQASTLPHFLTVCTQTN